jgi:hypothetical protein
VAGGIGAVDLEAIVLATVLVGETHVVKHCSRVKQLGIEPQPSTLACQRAPIVNAARMMEEKRGFRVPHQLGYFTSNPAVGTEISSTAIAIASLLLASSGNPLNDAVTGRKMFSRSV